MTLVTPMLPPSHFFDGKLQMLLWSLLLANHNWGLWFICHKSLSRSKQFPLIIWGHFKMFIWKWLFVKRCWKQNEGTETTKILKLLLKIETQKYCCLYFQYFCNQKKNKLRASHQLPWCKDLNQKQRKSSDRIKHSC